MLVVLGRDKIDGEVARDLVEDLINEGFNNLDTLWVL
jgi:predicted aldo/keto reductase-like oxidoreductase